jgi:hypothetical protein
MTDSADLWMGVWAQASEGTLPHYVYRPFKKKLEGNCEPVAQRTAPVSDFLTVGSSFYCRAASLVGF